MAVQEFGRMQDTQSKRGNKALVITQLRMSALGQKQKSGAVAIYVRYWGLSGRNQIEIGRSAHWFGRISN
jgi:hypothetical protein